MRQLAIQSVGAFTPVGLNVGQTMGSLRTRLARFQEVQVYPPQEGEPLVCAPTPILNDVAVGADRLVVMASHALAECARGFEAEPAPLLLCAPEPDEMTLNAEALLGRIAEHASVRIELEQSRLFAGGHAAVVPALAAADALLASGRVPACYVAGVDSLLDLARLRRLMGEQRIATEDVWDGVIPGEAAACLRISRRRDARALAWVRGFGMAEEPATRASRKPNSAQGMTRAVRAALADAEVTMQQIALHAYDLSGERYRFYEAAIAHTRLRPRRKDRLAALTVAVSVGEVGAALGPLTLAYAAFMLRMGGVSVPEELGAIPAGVLYTGGAEGPLRGAVFLSEIGHG
ncbi:MAG TPA: hypothetical protein VKN99_05280 [Polyangia bacterium]|nr:hypothetical protein [Polyangia bacterium]